jgi:uncharacterized membrane protein YczE
MQAATGPRLPARLVQLLLGLVLFGVSLAFLVRSRLGLDPWDVFHQGLARRTGFAIGTVTIAVGAVVLALWFPLHQRPGIGTLCNVVLVGLVLDATLTVFPQQSTMTARWICLIVGIGLNAVATGAYIGAGLGPGPRDGLMVGFAARGHSIRVVRTSIEVTVLLVGILLGGTAGIGTLLFAVCIGPLVHITLPLLSRTPASKEETS